MTVRAFSFGGGVQSTAVLVLAAKQEIDFNTMIFANTGDDSESPETLEYIKNISRPYAEKHGIAFHEVRRAVSLYEYAIGNNRTIPLPVYMSTGAPGTRKCTVDWKIKPVARKMRELGATKKEPGIIGIGISRDEAQRAADSRIITQENEFPLLDLKLNRRQCVEIIESAGLPHPPKSSCWFCPYKKMREWREMKQNNPEMFEKLCELDEKLNEKRTLLGKDRVYLNQLLMPMRDAVTDDVQLNLFDEYEPPCGSSCWT